MSGWRKLTLITNLLYVTVRDVRTMTNALLIVDDGDDGHYAAGRRYLARGFGPDSAWPTFDMALPTAEYVLSGYLLTFQDVTLALHRGIDRNYPEFDIEQFPDYPKVWDAVAVRTRKYWGAPGYPSLIWRKR